MSERERIVGELKERAWEGLAAGVIFVLVAAALGIVVSVLAVVVKVVFAAFGPFVGFPVSILLVVFCAGFLVGGGAFND